eukprot:TRINITY_DN3579_c0_g4_i2.p1 TRINITY_DN3579_c0_g4~~TRINITY_DN3579_c0_g4_i2.p1  ORF type:complete len:215 (-),score=49.84 TRINITY_DN3579_c0_g4_i2:338-982(-)
MTEASSSEATVDLLAYMSDDVRSLRRCWINERSSPDVMPFETELIRNMMEQIENQEANIGQVNDPSDALMASIYRMEIERIRFVIRSYLRTRLEKIQQNVLHILSNRELLRRLSPEEREFAEKYVDILETGFNQAFLNFIPEKLRSLTHQDRNEDMIPKPNYDTHVFCKVNQDVGIFAPQDDQDEVLEMSKGDLYLLRYRPIMELLLQNKVELI